VQDVDRARVLTAGSVMEPVRSVVNASAGPRAALRVMRDLQTSATFVVRRDRSFAGVVRDRDVLKQVKNGDGDLTAIILEATAVTADTALVDLVELAVESDLPIAVVDHRQRLLGVIPRVTLLAALGNVTTNTGELQVNEPPSTISMSIITETLRDTAPEGAQP
jgi:glycine betaine/proline transport system ATP-binding protein